MIINVLMNIANCAKLPNFESWTSFHLRIVFLCDPWTGCFGRNVSINISIVFEQSYFSNARKALSTYKSRRLQSLLPLTISLLIYGSKKCRSLSRDLSLSRDSTNYKSHRRSAKSIPSS